MSSPVIEFRKVSKAYADKDGKEALVVLRDLDLTIFENEFVCIIGPSGCGKTTLLNLAAGFEMPHRGEVLYRGSPVTAPSRSRSVIFQEYSLLPWMDVQSNVAFSVDRKTHTDRERMKVASKYLDMVGLGDACGKRPNDLSGGMKQRVAIARMLAMEPDVMLMDEPFSALDEQTRGHLDDQIKEIWRRDRRTVIFVTHNIDEALLLGTSVVMLSNDGGRIVGRWGIDDALRADASAMERVRGEISSRFQLCRCAVKPITAGDIE